MPLIEVRGLTKLYEMGDSIVRALDGVDLTIERGEFVAITGPSGSGKSTMMHLLGCLDRPTTGTYRLDGRDVSDLSDAELAANRNRKIGFVFQTFNLINRTTAAENVAVPLFYARKTNTRGPALRALERVGLAHRAKHNPNELSGGERQRVAIARAIVNDPPLLMADEPTGNLDTKTGQQIMAIFRELNAQGVTIVMVTHEMEIACQAQRIVQMRDGKIVYDGPSDGLPSAAPDERPAAAPVVAPRPGDPAVASVAGSAGDARVPACASDGPAPLPGPAGQRRVLPAANRALVLGLIGPLVLVGGVLAAVVLSRGINLKAIDPQRPPPRLIQMALIGGLSAMAAVAMSIVTLLVAAAGARRLRREAALWRGLWRLRTARVLGWGTLAVIVLGVLVNLVQSGRGGT